MPSTYLYRTDGLPLCPPRPVLEGVLAHRQCASSASCSTDSFGISNIYGIECSSIPPHRRDRRGSAYTNPPDRQPVTVPAKGRLGRRPHLWAASISGVHSFEISNICGAMRIPAPQRKLKPGTPLCVPSHLPQTRRAPFEIVHDYWKSVKNWMPKITRTQLFLPERQSTDLLIFNTSHFAFRHLSGTINARSWFRFSTK